MTSTTSEDQEPSILIIGAGTFGTSTAYHLSQTYKDPSRITLLDRWSPTSPLAEKTAAAVDTNRIIRTDYASHLYCDLANSALHFWFWSIAVQGHFKKTGWSVLERRTTAESGGDGFANAVRKTFVERGGDYTEDVTCEDLQRHHPILNGLDTREFPKGYSNPEAGWCDAERATTRLTKSALEAGVQRATGTVAELVFSEKEARVTGVKLTSGETLHADKVLLATGAWTSALLSPLEDALKIPEEKCIERQITAVGRVSAYFTLPEAEVQTLIDSKMPVLVLEGLADVIPPSQPNRTVKINDLRNEVVHTVSLPSGRRISAPPSGKQEAVSRKLRARSEAVVREALPVWSRGRTPQRWRLCYDAVTPTEDWLVCAHPDVRLGNLFVATGGSFHSYKYVFSLVLPSPLPLSMKNIPMLISSRFLPVAGKYITNVLFGLSNGPEKDAAWSWKPAHALTEKAGKEFGNTVRDPGSRVAWEDVAEKSSRL